MKINRRSFVKTTAFVSLVPSIISCDQKDVKNIEEKELMEAANSPILQLKSLTVPVIIESMELLKCGDIYVVRTRSKDGAEGISVTNKKVDFLYPVFLQQVKPFFIGKDARDIESLLYFEPQIKAKDGSLNVPTGYGFGMVNAEELLKKAKKVG